MLWTSSYMDSCHEFHDSKIQQTFHDIFALIQLGSIKYKYYFEV